MGQRPSHASKSATNECVVIFIIGPPLTLHLEMKQSKGSGEFAMKEGTRRGYRGVWPASTRMIAHWSITGQGRFFKGERVARFLS